MFAWMHLQMIPVAANDVAFSIHAVVLTAFTLFQIAIYDVSIYNDQQSHLIWSVDDDSLIPSTVELL